VIDFRHALLAARIIRREPVQVGTLWQYEAYVGVRCWGERVRAASVEDVEAVELAYCNCRGVAPALVKPATLVNRAVAGAK
jgi:hypothetical protein